MTEMLISEAERTYIVHGVQDNYRTDGRGCEDYRYVEIEVDVLSNANGSAKLSLGNTDVLVGIKADITEPSENRPDEGRLEFFVDFSANAAPAFEGKGGEELAQQISAVLENAYDHPACLNLKSLCLLSHKQCWILHIDIILLQCGGNLLDAVSLAVKAALYSTKIPKINVSCTEQGEPELELTDDPTDCFRIDVSHIPVVVTMNKIGHSHLVDATEEEEACTLARLYLGISPQSSVVYLRKEGGGSLDPESVNDMIETGKRVGCSLNTSLTNILKQNESSKAKQVIGFLK